jgi:hypothetical protein
MFSSQGTVTRRLYDAVTMLRDFGIDQFASTRLARCEWHLLK